MGSYSLLCMMELMVYNLMDVYHEVIKCTFYAMNLGMSVDSSMYIWWTYFTRAEF